MFMIVHNLSLFLIAVTPTVVVPTAVILRRNLGWILTILDHFGQFFDILDRVEMFCTIWTVLDNIRQYKRIEEFFLIILKLYWAILERFGPFWTILKILDHFDTFEELWTILNNCVPFWTNSNIWTILDHLKHRQFRIFKPF